MPDRKLWWKERPEDFERFKRELEAFDSLHFQIENDAIVITGSWAVFGKEKLFTRYEIKVVLPDDFPSSVPQVYEVGGALKKEPDFHFNPEDNSACLFAPPERHEKWPIGAGIREFLNGPVKEFFFSQAYRHLEGKWPFGEWSHGNEGVLEFYASRLGVGDLRVLREFLELALLPKVYRQWRCPCGGVTRVTACHGARIRQLSGLIPAGEIRGAIGLVDAERRKGRTAVVVRSRPMAP